MHASVAEIAQDVWPCGLLAVHDCATPSPVSKQGASCAARAAGAVQFITAVVAYGTRESATFNFVAKGSDVLLIVLILCLSFPHANRVNWEDFWHFGSDGVFSAAATVFFAYSGAARHLRPVALAPVVQLMMQERYLSACWWRRV